MANDLVVVMDCGSTNATVIAVDDRGEIAASAGRPNGPVRPPEGEEGWRIWDLERVWDLLCDACREVCAQVDPERIRAVTICTFGADGAPVRADGSLTYPPICWQDDRTEPLVERFSDRMPLWEAFEETGYQVIRFNSLLRLIWLREHVPEALERATCWVMMPGLLSHRLTGEFSMDPTSGGTMMAMEMGRRDWSDRMLALAGLDASCFPRWVEPGESIGTVRPDAAEETGLPAGIPVVAAGHDTQFAAIGSGASPGEAILSSGTWEILMLPVDRFAPNRFGFEEGLQYECSALAGRWDPQLLMMGSGVLEWLRSYFYADVTDRQDAYGKMIEDARAVRPGADGVTVLPSFVAETGPTKKYNTRGTILGLEPTTHRGQVYRAGLEGLSFQLRHALGILMEATGFDARGLRVVGGGSRNELWNQIRADVTGLPVTTIAQREATVLGAAMFAFVGAGVFSSVEDAQAQIARAETAFEPSDAREAYEEAFERYRMAPPALEEFYRSFGGHGYSV